MTLTNIWKHQTTNRLYSLKLQVEEATPGEAGKNKQLNENSGHCLFFVQLRILTINKRANGIPLQFLLQQFFPASVLSLVCHAKVCHDNIISSEPLAAFASVCQRLPTFASVCKATAMHKVTAMQFPFRD